jgi:hypothetical protein
MDTTYVRLPSVRSASVELEDKSEEAGTANFTFDKGNRTRGTFLYNDPAILHYRYYPST